MGTPQFSILWVVVRLLTAAAIVAAIVGQAIVTFGGAAAEGRDVVTTVANFFSFFTILSNLFAAIVLVIAAVWLVRFRDTADRDPSSLAVALACVSTYMIITGIVYNALLRNIPLPQGTTVPWSNEILHVYAPILLLLDVLLAPRVRALRWRALAMIAAFPVVWVVYTLLRGPFVTNPFDGKPTWYPYPFLNPANGGYGSVTLYVIGIAAAILLLGAGVIWVGRRRARTALASADQRKSASRRPASV